MSTRLYRLTFDAKGRIARAEFRCRETGIRRPVRVAVVWKDVAGDWCWFKAGWCSPENWRQVQGKAFMNESNAGNICFRLDYESGIRLGDFQDKPKVQKYHTEKEFHSLFIGLFRSVKVAEMSNNVTAICASARAVDVARLREAIEFEFDLPYPDGTRMGLIAEAKAAFEKRLGVEL